MRGIGRHRRARSGARCPHGTRPHRSQARGPRARAACRAEASEKAASIKEEIAEAVEDNKPDTTKGRMTYKPESYTVLVQDAAAAIGRGLKDGMEVMEVEFPAIAGLDGYKGASDMYIDANTQLGIKAGRELFKESGKKTVVLLPDGPELARSSKLFKTTLEMCDGVAMSHLYEGREPLKQGLQMLLGLDKSTQAPEAAADADVHIVINITTTELPDVQKYLREVAKPGSAVVFWNCELDTLRGDLGLFGFPGKDVQYDFLSRCKPVFYVRQRDYSKTVSIAPFIVNYSGCLFREYPGPWQVMLRQDNGVYACVAEDSTRYTLGEVKEQLIQAMGLDTESEGSTMQFLRRGYKTTTWWEEDDGMEKSDAWRT